MKRIIRNRRLTKEEADRNNKVREQVMKEFPPAKPEPAAPVVDPRFEGNDNQGKPRTEYVARVAAMDDEKLYDETKHKIWLSAYAANNPRSDYHWHVDAIYDQWSKRGKLDQYQKAFNEVEKGAR